MVFTEKHKEFFVNDGFKYWFDSSSKKNPLLKFWRCSNRRTGCPARLHSRNGVFVKQLHQYNNESDPAGIQVRDESGYRVL